MKISYNWIKELSGVDWSPEEMAHRLTMCGTACEDITPTAKYLDGVVVGEVLEVKPIEGSDKIRLATVNIGVETLDLVCGAPNVAVGQKVAVATLGAKLNHDIVIKKAKIRGVESCGMICAEDELGISENHAGIMVLEDTAKVGTPLVEALDYDDYVLEFELTPNRPDSMSALGIARDVCALAGTKLKYPEMNLKESSESVADVFKVAIECPEQCPRFTARIVRDITIGESPWWLKKRLLMSGIRPISNAVDISNYVMLEMGNPMHAFDLAEVGSDQIVVRMAKDKEKFTTLDGNEHELTPHSVLVTNGKVGKGIGGVMGGLDSEVSDSTKDVLIEVAYFEPSVIRKSRKEVGLVTEASQRFEKGVDPNNPPTASARAAYLFQELCGGKVSKGIVDCYPKPIEPRKLELRHSRYEQIIGASVSCERMTEILKGLEFAVEGFEPLIVTVPTFRPDVEREIDLIEEVARIKGYDAIPDAISNMGPLFTPLNEEDELENEIRQVLTGCGFDEMLGHGLAHSKQATMIEGDSPMLRIVNPVSEDLDIMRSSLTPTALNVVAHNLSHRQLDLALFEIGAAYFPPNDKGDWVEESRLLLLVTGQTPLSWRSKPRGVDFYDVKSGLDALMTHFGLSSLEYKAGSYSFMDKDCNFEVLLDGQSIGRMGLLAAKAGKKFDIKQPVYLCEIRLAEIMAKRNRLKAFEPLPVYPAAPRDLAMVVKESVRVADLIDSVKQVSGDLAESVEVFDVYAGDQIGKGLRSIGISIIFRSQAGSMESSEVDVLLNKITETLKKQFNAEIRDK